MNDLADTWYVRLPDGRVFRARNTAAVRQQFGTGRLPTGTRLRRRSGEAWLSPERHSEFADLSAQVTPPDGYPRAGGPRDVTPASRLDPEQFHPVGVRAALTELFSALDSALAPAKFTPTLVTAALVGLLAGVAAWPGVLFTLNPPGWGWLLLGSAVLLLARLAALLGRLTAFELSRLRPARRADVLPGVRHDAARLALIFLIFAALLFAIPLAAGEGSRLLLTRAGGDELPRWESALAEGVAGLGALVVFALGLAAPWLLLLGPVLAVEGCGLFVALRQWLALVRQHGGRALLLQVLAVGVGGMLLAPVAGLALVLPAILGDPSSGVLAVRAGLLGGVGTCLFGYLLVASVFVYLDLRYDSRGA